MICNADWHGLYSGQTALLTPDSVAHPAKMAPALVFRIFDHLAELGLLHPDDTVLDPMAGTGLTGLAWAAKGGRSVLVELEERFVGFIGENKAQLARTLGREVEIEVLQGDARHLSELLGERGLKAVTSPPYGHNAENGGLNTLPPRNELDQAGRSPNSPSQAGGKAGYSDDPSNIGNLPDKPLKAVTSPPYLEAQGGSGLATGMRHRDGHSLAGSGYFISEHGTTPGQIGQERQEDYLSAMRQVYAEVAKVADVLVCVLKDPTRNRKIRPLGYDTWKLLEAVGWTIVDYHRAILFSETQQVDLLGNIHRKQKGRISFFKRIGMAKGIPASNFEHVIIAARGSGVSSMTGTGARRVLTAECTLPIDQPGV